MYDIKLGHGCGIKATLLTPAGAMCDLRRARYIGATLILPSGATMPCADVSFNEITGAVYVRLLANRELTAEGKYAIIFNVKIDKQTTYSTPVVDFVEVKTDAEEGFKELTLAMSIGVVDFPENVAYTGASPKIGPRGTWLVFDDELNAYVDTGILPGVDISGLLPLSLGNLTNVDEAVDKSAPDDRILAQLAGSSHWTTKRLSDIVGLDTAALAEYLTTNKYATQEWVQKQGYLKAEALADYATQTWVNRNFIQAIGTDGIYLSLVKGDGTKTRLIPPCAYGTRDTILRRGSANVNFDNDGTLRHFFSSSSMTEGRPMGDGHIIHMEWDNSLSWASQLCVPSHSSRSMQWRAQDGTTWASWRKLLDEANYAETLDGRYLKKASDTLTGTLTAKRDQFLAYGAAGIDMNNSDITRLNGLWFADAYDSAGEAINFYVDGSLWSRLGASGGTLYFNPSVGTSAHALGHKVWHEGNDGEGSGLDADKLDGLHSTAFARCDQWQQVDLNTVNSFGFMMNKTSADATTDRHYPIQEAGLLIYGTAAYSSANQIYGSFSTNRWFARGGGGSATNKTAWREFAFLDSNVASASKLATARTIWGKSFNGENNVLGDFKLYAQSSEDNNSSAKLIFASNDWRENDPYIQGTNIGGYGRKRIGFFQTNVDSWTPSYSEVLSIMPNGQIGIGTTSPSQKLHVAGNVLVSGEAYYHTEGRAGNSWNNGFGALSVGIMNNSSQTPLLVAYRYGDLNWTTPHANRLFAMELLNSGSVLRFGFGGAAKFYFEKDGTFHTEKGLWAAQYVSSKGASASSDIRLKYGLEPLTLTLEQIAAAPAVRYLWRDTGEVDLGSTSQYWLRILPEGVRIQPNGFYGMAYDKIALVASIMLARKSLDHERRIEALERENRERKLNRLTA